MQKYAHRLKGAIMSEITIVKEGVTTADVDAVVNAANERLRAGGGVCGAVFADAGHADMQAACDAIGHCEVGSAVITPGFALKARYVIHAVGPKWHDGNSGEERLLASCYVRSLDLAAEHGCRSIAFPVISSGIFGYPKEEAWRVALTTCKEWLDCHPDVEMSVRFCVLGESSFALGNAILAEILRCAQNDMGRSE